MNFLYYSTEKFFVKLNVNQNECGSKMEKIRIIDLCGRCGSELDPKQS